MTKKEKQLLVKALCGYLPYGLKICKEKPSFLKKDGMHIQDVQGIDLALMILLTNTPTRIKDMKPYLRPMSSMTEDEKKELLQISNFDSDVDDICYDSICFIERTLIDIIDIANFISWLNARHFDYRGLIEKGLAIAVTEENNPYK